MMRNKQDAYIASIYEKAMINRSQLEKNRDAEAQKDLDANFWSYLDGRLKVLVQSVVKLHQMKGISKKQIDDAERGVSNLLSLVRMYTLPEVINQLNMDALRERMLKKIKDEER